MSLRRVGLSNSLSSQTKISNKRFTLSRVSLRRFPFPTAAAAAAIPVYIEDVFSTYLYTGTGSSQTITNNIDTSTKGGLVWIKGRSGATGHRFTDTVRGATKSLESNSTAAEATESTGLTAFGTTGFTIGADADYNTNAATYASWTFRKQAKFFDVVTYTGNAVSGTQISHNLGSTPGCIIVKKTDGATTWAVYHRGLSGNEYLNLNNTDSVSAIGSGATVFGNGTSLVAPTSSAFTVGTSVQVNGSGGAYIAYLFAHDAGGFGATGSDNIISCGSFTGSGSVNLGWEPQWLLLKNATSANDWFIDDTMRGFTTSTAAHLYANLTQTELGGSSSWQIQNTGFSHQIGGSTWVYIAIRRGPMKTPTSGTSVYNAIARTGSGAATTISGFGFPVDLGIVGIRTNPITINGTTFDRLRGGSSSGAPRLFTSSTSGDWSDATSVTTLDVQDGFKVGGGDGTVNNSNKTYIDWVFRRAPGFFDVVCYTGTGADRTVTHNLGVVPELMIIKVRGSITDNWQVYCSALDVSGGDYLLLNDTAAKQTNGSTRFTAAPTSTEMKLATNGGVNGSGYTYVAYLFATLAGISKVGSYTGTGTTLSVDCGFTSGARFVLIKRTNSTGDWYVWDSARGIVAGNDPYLLLNSTAAEVTGTDYIDPYSPGFEISSTAPAAINANGGTYIFLAIA